MRPTPLAIAFVAATAAAALLAACGSDSTDPSGSTAAGHRYSIDLTANTIFGDACQWTETDHGSLVVTMNPASHAGTVSNITNNPAQLVESPCTSPCTETLLANPKGPIDIETINSVVEDSTTRVVTVSYESTVEAPTFRDVCGNSTTTAIGPTSTVGTYLQFTDNGASQDIQYVDPATGQPAHMLVTPTAQ